MSPAIEIKSPIFPNLETLGMEHITTAEYEGVKFALPNSDRIVDPCEFLGKVPVWQLG